VKESEGFNTGGVESFYVLPLLTDPRYRYIPPPPPAGLRGGRGRIVRENAE